LLFYDKSAVALALADRALERVRALGLAPTPQAFAVWYAIYGERSQELSADGVSLRDAHMDELFLRYLAEDQEDGASDELTSALGTALKLVEEFGGDVQRYDKAVSDASAGMGIAGTLEHLRTVIATLAAETTRMVRKNAGMRRRLDDMSGRMEKMRSALKSARRHAETDTLTGLANRRRFDQTLRGPANRAADAGAQVVVMMVDIDHFKTFNDTHGHAFGDQVLKLIARVLSENVRPGDVAARFGGEEFALVLANATIRDGKDVSGRIMRTLAGRELVNRSTGTRVGAVTLSIGLTDYVKGEAPGDVLRRADEALYEAKAAGRNRVVARFGPPPRQVKAATAPAAPD
jgi:diguanylate cyclase